MRGVDVNNLRGSIDWRKVRQVGFEFAIIKATEGRTWDDPLFAHNMSAARAAGLRVGAYHYARPDHNSPGAEADHFLRVHRPRPGELLPALDWETPPAKGQWAIDFLKAVEARIGARPLFYTYPDFLRQIGSASFGALSRFPLWYAAYGANDGNEHPIHPPSQFQLVVHQFSSKAHVSGISGNADVNVLKVNSLDQITYRPTMNGGGSFDGALEMFAGGQLVAVGGFRKPDQTVTDEARRWIQAVRAAGGHGRVEPHMTPAEGPGAPPPPEIIGEGEPIPPPDAVDADEENAPPPEGEVQGLGGAGRWSEAPNREELEREDFG